jgi:hypothetical protein
MRWRELVPKITALLAVGLLSGSGASAATKTPPEINLAEIHAGPVGNPLPLRPLVVRDGVLSYNDGGEVALWGVNYQPSLSWEFNDTLRHAGVTLDGAALKRIVDTDLRHLKLMETAIIRVHLVPTDFTDEHGDLVETPFLDTLDYLIDRCHKNGIYVYLTLMNEMGKPYLPNSVFAGYKREQWIFDDTCVAANRHYVKALLSRKNPYTGRTYAKEPAIGLLELINEPDYPTYENLKTDRRFAALAARFLSSLAAGARVDDQSVYLQFRDNLLAEYLKELLADVRSTGAAQPIVWNLNWPQFIGGHGDIVATVAASSVDAVSFSLYPGQGDLPQNYWAHPTDLSGKNYIPYLQKQYDDYWQLRWTLGQRFAKKAKLVYEFECFYNQSGYMYPEMAKVCRALGAQTATMWRYMPRVAATEVTASSASHYLNLVTTPCKAVSAIIAAHVFEQVPRFTPYAMKGLSEEVFAPFATSFPRNLSLESSTTRLLHSGPLDWDCLPVHPEVATIIGVGSSPLVSYDGTGAYFISVSASQIRIEVFPDDLVGKPPYIGLVDGKICKLDHAAVHQMQLHLAGWSTTCKAWRLEKDSRVSIPLAAGKLAIDVAAGQYDIEAVHY